MRKSVTKVKLTDKLGNSVWSRLKEYILGQCPNTDEVGTLYMCHYCKSSFKNNKLPPRCVLNGLQPVPIPAELAKLDALSAQLIQLAKCYQTVVRLGTYTEVYLSVWREISLRHLPTFQVPATIPDKLLGVVSSYITVHFYKNAEKQQRVVQKGTCAHLTLTGKYAFS